MAESNIQRGFEVGAPSFAINHLAIHRDVSSHDMLDPIQRLLRRSSL
jgi:hypothetical protein